MSPNPCNLSKGYHGEYQPVITLRGPLASASQGNSVPWRAQGEEMSSRRSPPYPGGLSESWKKGSVSWRGLMEYKTLPIIP